MDVLYAQGLPIAWLGAILWERPAFQLLSGFEKLVSLSIKIHVIRIAVNDNRGAAVAVEDDISFNSLCIVARPGDGKGKARYTTLYAPGALIDVEIVHFDQQGAGETVLVSHPGLLGALAGVGAVQYIVGALNEAGNGPVAVGAVTG